MNERIMEMAIAAGFNPVNCTGSNLLLFEKFAELIVKECAKRVDYWESKQGEHCEDLLKHFGVT